MRKITVYTLLLINVLFLALLSPIVSAYTRITILVYGFEVGGRFPSDITSLWYPLSIDGRDIAQEMTMKRLDYTSKNIIDYKLQDKPPSFLDLLKLKTPVSSLREKAITINDSLVPPEFVLSQRAPAPDEVEWINTIIEKQKNNSTLLKFEPDQKTDSEKLFSQNRKKFAIIFRMKSINI